jgi:UDP-3-O-[3-hydroxymyristoyl] glucosamine N-acyltransferase
MLIYDPTRTCVAISYNSALFSDVKYFIKTTDQVDVELMHPEEFFQTNALPHQYINLVHKNSDERKAISDKLDALKAKRFSYAHPQAFFNPADVSPGSILWPLSTLQHTANIGTDVIVIHNSVIGHNTKVGRGTFMSSMSVIGGSAVVGEFCWIAFGTVIKDGIEICDNVRTGIGTIVRKSISEPGTYVTENNIIKLY